MSATRRHCTGGSDCGQQLFGGALFYLGQAHRVVRYIVGRCKDSLNVCVPYGEWAGSDGGMVGEVSRALAGREQATLSTRSDVSRMYMLARQTERAVGKEKKRKPASEGKRQSCQAEEGKVIIVWYSEGPVGLSGAWTGREVRPALYIPAGTSSANKRENSGSSVDQRKKKIETEGTED